MVKKARLIYNPVSGNEQMPAQVAGILNTLEQAGYEASAYQTTVEDNSAKNEAKRVGEAGFDLVVAAGGDGTINEVVNGIAPLENRPKMAIIPAGTTNDFARALHIPRDDMQAAAKVILEGKTMGMDIGLAGDKYFMNIAGSGSLTELTYGVPSEFKSVLGYAAYVIKGAEMLPKIHAVNMHLKWDGGEYKGKLSLFLLAMTNSIGGFEQVVPDASLADGEFTLIGVKTANPVDVLRLLAMAFNGNHINDPNVIYEKTTHLSVEVLDKNEEVPVNLDGELGGYLPLEFQNLKQHIEFFVK